MRADPEIVREQLAHLTPLRAIRSSEEIGGVRINYKEHTLRGTRSLGTNPLYASDGETGFMQA